MLRLADLPIHMEIALPLAELAMERADLVSKYGEPLEPEGENERPGWPLAAECGLVFALEIVSEDRVVLIADPRELDHVLRHLDAEGRILGDPSPIDDIFYVAEVKNDLSVLEQFDVFREDEDDKVRVARTGSSLDATCLVATLGPDHASAPSPVNVFEERIDVFHRWMAAKAPPPVTRLQMSRVVTEPFMILGQPPTDE